VQIDTGVTAHPLLGGKDFTFVDLHAADDLFGAGHRNIDELLSGLLRNPGHGTKTSSVIIGRGTEEFPIAGIAQGAHLVPIRATQSVTLFPKKIGELEADAHRISRGLYTAARGSGFGLRLKQGERVHVISMSLGTFPETPGLCDAVKAATDAGIIVVVAAGNKVKHTTYPAKCPTAVAVAGSTVGDTPWSGSAGSREVAVAAPAEAVWTASVVNGESCIEASSGTSFATALVAGLAAEWSVRHQMPTDPAAIKANPELISGRYKVFRDTLRATATKWKNPAWQEKYGAGIVNATALFNAP
jgi:thermitase